MGGYVSRCLDEIGRQLTGSSQQLILPFFFLPLGCDFQGGYGMGGYGMGGYGRGYVSLEC